MDEPDLRQIITSASKILIPKFDEIKDAATRIVLVLEEIDYDQFVVDLGLATSKDEKDYPRKNIQLAQRNKEDGNAAFQSGNHEMAILLYTEAMKYSPLNIKIGEGESMAMAAANRSASHFQLNKYFECLTDIELALEAGYPSNLVHKLYIRQCRCLLELGRILEAQKAFDKAMDAIDRSGLKKDARKSLTVDLQEAFINLAKSMESNPPPDFELNQKEKKIVYPEWTKVKAPHPHYPAACSAVAIKFDPQYGRHVVATRDIEVGEVIFNEEPIVFCLNQSVATASASAAAVLSKDSDYDVTTPACHTCLQYIKWIGGIVPCPTCDFAAFCSIKCRNDALSSYHRFECRLTPLFDRIRINRLPLIMSVLRAFTQKPIQYFVQEDLKGSFGAHDIRNGESEQLIKNGETYRSDDYKNLYHLVTHEERRDSNDVTTKFIFAGVLLSCLKAIGYFDGIKREEGGKASKEEILIGRLMSHFMQCFQFNMHLIESVLENRLIAPDSETRIWKKAELFGHGEFLETTPLGGGIFPTIANVNHSCDPNFSIVFMGKRAVAVSDRKIRAGEEIHDSYGAVYYHMEKAERQQYLKGSHWFLCTCSACKNDFPQFQKLPRDYLKLQGSYFKYKRCNRKELQKDVDKLKKKIKMTVAKPDENCFEEVRQMYNEWMNLLDELLFVPGHQDFINVRRGMKNCMCLQSPNRVKVKEDEALQEAKAKYKEKQKGQK